MRVTLALAATVSAQLDAWSDDLREIHAIGIENQWLVEKLAPSALFGRHERRLRRQAEDCTDNHPRCDEYAEYCDNVQFATTCAASCNTCETSSSEPEAASSSDPSACEDQLGYCEQMEGFCGNPNYEGVRLYCRKTCNSCDETIEVEAKGAASETDSIQTCEDKEFCVNFPYCQESEILRERIKDSCPVTCKVAACQAYWTIDATESPFKEAPPADACVDASMACSGVTELCQKDDFKDTLETYCKQTCGFCTVDAVDPRDGEEATGACVNKYPNCDTLQWMCEEEQYKGPYIKMCPITCGVCEGDGSAPAATSAPAEPTKCEDTAEHCGSLSDYCDKPETEDMMAQQCALTCGFCQVEGSENETAEVTTQVTKQATAEDTCADTPGTDCQKYLLYCDNTNTQIPKVCKKSCGHCDKKTEAVTEAVAATTTVLISSTTTTTTTAPPTTKASTTIASTMAESECAPVKDKSGKCNSYKKFCQNPKYKAKLASQCPATCGVCIKSKPEAKAPTATGTGAVCKDNVPAQCGKMKRFCGQPKYEKVLKQKCSKTCGFCTSESDGSDPTSSPAASSGEKFGNWSINWSKCNSKCKQYKSRKCLKAPCPKTQLYQFRDCPAEENANIPACSGAAKPAAKPCSNKAGAEFCRKHSAKCTSKKPKELDVMNSMCRKECAICT